MPIEDKIFYEEIPLLDQPIEVTGDVDVTGSISVTDGTITANIQGQRDDNNYIPLSVGDDGILRVNLTNAEPVSGTFTPLIPNLTSSGNLTSISDSVELTYDGRNSAAFVLGGSWAGTVVLDSTCDGVTWGNTWFSSVNPSIVSFGIPVPTLSTTTNGIYKVFNTAGVNKYRVRASAISSGTVTVAMNVVASAASFIYTAGSVIQAVAVDSANSSSVNIAASGTFTGTATTTLGVVGIQVSIKTDQNCIVYVDQSPDGDNWDITDSYIYYYSLGGAGWTVQAINSYYRVRVTNVGQSSTTYMRLQTALCPIVEAVPRSLSENGNLKTEIMSIHGMELGTSVNVSPMDEMIVAEHTRLVGAQYSGTILDPNFWITPTKTGSSEAAVASGYLQLRTGRTANSSVVVNSNRTGRYVSGFANYYRSIVNCPAITGTNTRRWGAFNSLDGYFFEYDGTNLSVVSRRNGEDNKISSGSFNGNLGSTYKLDTLVHTYEIYYTNTSARFCIDEVLIHKITGSLVPNTWNLNLKIGSECTNSNGTATNNILNIRANTINRIGHLTTNGHWYHITTNETRILKYGAGTLHRVICNDTGAPGNTIILYDGIDVVGASMIATVNLNKSNLSTLEYNLPFGSGLTYVSNSSIDLTIVYE